MAEKAYRGILEKDMGDGPTFQLYESHNSGEYFQDKGDLGSKGQLSGSFWGDANRFTEGKLMEEVLKSKN